MEFTTKQMFPYGTCPKCSCSILGGGPEAQKEHNDNCQSTAVTDGAKTISEMVDKMVMKDVRKELEK